ncbi:MAG: glycosyltransferase family 2 protein [Candidatus Nealsonbacteria bacterium]|nr:glycosyltransferase family 2 protein [Candidatus Nealsonbacteria bacterium]
MANQSVPVRQRDVPEKRTEVDLSGDQQMVDASRQRVTVSVVIPVYQSEQTLLPLVTRLRDVFAEMGVGYEIVLVDDASADDSWKVMQRLRSEYSGVKIIQHMRNFGQHKAILCGLRHSTGEFVIGMDDDLQHPPEEIPKLLEALEGDEETDVVVGAYETKRHSWLRNLGSWAVNRITSRVFGIDPNLKMTSFYILRRSVVKEMANATCNNPRISQLLLLTTNRIKNVRVAHHARQNGLSGYSFSRLVTDALDNILSNSSLPLQLVSYLGFGCSLMSFVVSICYLCKYLFGTITVPGWTTIILLLLFFFGIVLFSLGVVGEYLIRILRQVQQPSRCTIRQKEV